MTDRSDEIARLREEVAELGTLLLQVNDAFFGFAGIVGRAIVDAGIIGRDELADALENRAGQPGREDHNAGLRVFARAVRMNLPGGRFEIIEGGRTDDLDPR